MQVRGSEHGALNPIVLRILIANQNSCRPIDNTTTVPGGMDMIDVFHFRISSLCHRIETKLSSDHLERRIQLAQTFRGCVGSKMLIPLE